MEILSIKELGSRIVEKENQLDYYITKKNRALMRVMPKSMQIKEVSVMSSLDVSHDSLLEYVAEIEKYDEIITILNEELQDLQRFEERELKRLKKYDKVEEQVILLKDEGKTWREINILIERREIACSLRTAKRIWSKYTKRRDVGE